MENDVQQSTLRVENSSIKREITANNKIILQVAIGGIMAALVAVTTYYLQIPIPATNGYFNIGEVIIYLTAILFGPYIGAFAGGVGAAIADLASGSYAVYAPATLIAKGLEGLIIGFIYLKIKKKDNWKFNVLAKIIAIIPGGIIMVSGYLIYEYFILGYGAAAFIEVPLNFLQVAAGMVAAIPLVSPLEEQIKLEALPFYKSKKVMAVNKKL